MAFASPSDLERVPAVWNVWRGSRAWFLYTSVALLNTSAVVVVVVLMSQGRRICSQYLHTIPPHWNLQHWGWEFLYLLCLISLILYVVSQSFVTQELLSKSSVLCQEELLHK